MPEEKEKTADKFAQFVGFNQRTDKSTDLYYFYVQKRARILINKGF